MSALPDLIALIEPLARRFYGEPNQRLSRGNELRFGTNGSLSVDIKLGRWFDFEEGSMSAPREGLARYRSERGAWLETSPSDLPKPMNVRLALRRSEERGFSSSRALRPGLAVAREHRGDCGCTGGVGATAPGHADADTGRSPGQVDVVRCSPDRGTERQ